MPRSIVELEKCAMHHLDHYMSPLGPRNFLVYDVQGDPSSFQPVDAMAAGLLAVRIKPSTIKAMFQEDQSSPHVRLRMKVVELLAEATRGIDSDDFFQLADPGDPSKLWQLVQECFDSVSPKAVKGIRSVTLSKMLHRKLPYLVPIVDSEVASFYKDSVDRPADLFKKMKFDWGSNRSTIDDWAKGRRTSDNRPVSTLRIADIVIWEHVVTGCTSGSNSPPRCGYRRDCRHCYP